jgi:hypothetical protein
MGTSQDIYDEYRKQMQKGIVVEAYQGILNYLNELRIYFTNKYPDHFVSSSLYQGAMNLSFFAFNPTSIKAHGLKIAIVFLHKEFRFEVWLVGTNKGNQEKYWAMLKEDRWSKYDLVKDIKGADAIACHIISQDPNFTDPIELTNQIEGEALKFITTIEDHLATRTNQ